MPPAQRRARVRARGQPSPPAPLPEGEGPEQGNPRVAVAPSDAQQIPSPSGDLCITCRPDRVGGNPGGAQAPLLSYVRAPSFPRKREPTGHRKLCKGLLWERARVRVMLYSPPYDPLPQETHRSRPPPRRHQQRVGPRKIHPARPPLHPPPLVGAPTPRRLPRRPLRLYGRRSLRTPRRIPHGRRPESGARPPPPHHRAASSSGRTATTKRSSPTPDTKSLDPSPAPAANSRPLCPTTSSPTCATTPRPSTTPSQAAAPSPSRRRLAVGTSQERRRSPPGAVIALRQ